MILKPRKIKYVLIVNYLLISLLPILLVGLISHRYLSNRVKAIVEKDNELLGMVLSEQIASVIIEPLNTFNSLIPYINEHLFVKDELQIMLDRILENSPLFEVVYILDKERKMIGFGAGEELSKKRSDYIGNDMSQFPFVQDVDSSKKPIWSDAFLSPFSGELSLALVVPFGDNLLVGDFNIDHLHRITQARKNVGSVFRVFIIDANGVVLSNPNVAMTEQYQNIKTLLPVQKGLEGEYGVYSFVYSGEEYIGTIMPFEETCWLILVAQNEKEALSQVTKIGWFFVAGLFLSAGLISLLSVFVAGKIGRPITEFISVAKEIAKGDYASRFPVQIYAELGELAESFNYMTESIETRDECIGNIVGSSPVGIGLTENGVVARCNNTLQRMLGCESGELIGETFASMFFSKTESADVNIRLDNQIMKSGVGVVETEFRKNDGHAIYVLLSVAKLCGKVDCKELVFNVLDITERKQDEQIKNEYRRQLQNLVNKLIMVEEQERRQIATYLHDSLGQSLVFAKMKLDLYTNSLESNDNESLSNVSALLGEIIGETQVLTYDLGSVVLYELGLEKALNEWIAEEMCKCHRVHAELSYDVSIDKFSMNKEFKSFVFRSTKEMLVNIAKHAQASHASVCINLFEDFFILSVEDNGVGFKDGKGDGGVFQKGSYGLFSIRERVKSFGGQMVISSNESDGTKIEISIPMDNVFEGDGYNDQSTTC